MLKPAVVSPTDAGMTPGRRTGTIPTVVDAGLMAS
jgi:hypothetical protein